MQGPFHVHKYCFDVQVIEIAGVSFIRLVFHKIHTYHTTMRIVLIISFNYRLNPADNVSVVLAVTSVLENFLILIRKYKGNYISACLKKQYSIFVIIAEFVPQI